MSTIGNLQFANINHEDKKTVTITACPKEISASAASYMTFVQFSEEKIWYTARNEFHNCPKFNVVESVISPRMSSTQTNAARRLTRSKKSVIFARPYRFPNTVS